MLKEASGVFKHQVNPKKQQKSEYYLNVEVDNSEWYHDSLDEFFADYRRTDGGAYYTEKIGYDSELEVQLNVLPMRDGTHILTIVRVKLSQRSQVEAVFDVFERHWEAAQVPEDPEPPPPPRELPKVFIGHGNNPSWKDLKDHLHELHHYDVIAYEIGARAHGHEIRDILADMLQASSFAILVMTGKIG